MDQRLETFLTVCATMNYRKAAEQLHLTQPAVTKQIQALEALYGVRLFTYDSRKLRKTAQGETLEIYAISQRYQDEELRRALKRQEKTSLRIGATKSIGDYILLLAQLEGGELDFVVLEGIFDKSRYESFLLRNEPYIGICAKDHPFSGCEVPMDELFSERLILREPGSGTRKILERELMQCGYTIEAFRANVCISSFKLIRHLVSEGCGVSFLYEAVVKNDAQFGHFSCPPLTGVHELNVVCLKNTNVPALARRFLDL